MTSLLGDKSLSDVGPWTVRRDDTRKWRICSENFTHDVELILTGDFGDETAMVEYAADIARRLSAPSATEENIEPFVVKQYTDDPHPSIKGNGFDGLTLGDYRDEAEAFVKWLNERLTPSHVEERTAASIYQPVKVASVPPHVEAQPGVHPTDDRSLTTTPLPSTEETNWERLVRLLRDPKCTGRYDLMADAAAMIKRLAGHVGQLEAALAGSQARVDQLSAVSSRPRKLWLWKNFVDGRPEYWAFDNPYPCVLGGGDPQTLGEPCGYAIFKESTQGRTNVPEAEVIAAIKRASARSATPAITDVAAERKRQIDREGWDTDHDDEHIDGALACAAACYAAGGKLAWMDGASIWPWSEDWWKPKDRRRDLVRAAALIVAEIERLDRKCASPDGRGAAT